MFENDNKDEGDEEHASCEDDEDDNVNELVVLSRDEQKQVLEETAVVCNTVTKVRNLILK